MPDTEQNNLDLSLAWNPTSLSPIHPSTNEYPAPVETGGKQALADLSMAGKYKYHNSTNTEHPNQVNGYDNQKFFGKDWTFVLMELKTSCGDKDDMMANAVLQS